MKKLLLMMFAAVMICLSACSKKENVSPLHNVKITASATAAFSVKISTIKSGLTTQVVADAQSAVTAPYAYDITLSTGDEIFIEFGTDVENTVTYKITDNGNTVTQDSKELGTRTTTTLRFTAG